MARRAVTFLLLIALALVVHGRFAFRFFPCVGWDKDWPAGPDDFLHLFGSCGYPIDFGNFLHAFSPQHHFHHFYYCPLLHLFYLAEGAAFQFQPFGYHLASAFLHGVTACALFALGNRLAPRPKVWLAAAALFAVNPTPDQAIYWLACQHVELVATFVLLTLLSFIEWRTDLSRRWGGAFAVCCVLAYASKPDALILVPLLLLANYLLLPRECRVGKRDVGALAAFGGLTVVYLWLNRLAYLDQAQYGFTGVDLREPFVFKAVAWAYLQLVAFTQFEPLHAAAVLHHVDAAAIGIIVALFVFILATCFWCWRTNERTLLFALSFSVLAALMPALGVGTYAVRMSRFWYSPVLAQTLLAALAAARALTLRENADSVVVDPSKPSLLHPKDGGLGAIGWAVIASLLCLLAMRHLPTLLTPLVPLEGLLLGPLWVLLIAVVRRGEGGGTRFLRSALTVPGVLGTALFVRGVAMMFGVLGGVPQFVAGFWIPVAVAVLALAATRASLENCLLVAGALVLLSLYADAPPRAEGQLTLDVTLPLLIGLAGWWAVERACPEPGRRIEWQGARLATALAFAAGLTAVVFVAKVNRLGRGWVAAGEEGRHHVREVFERFDIPRERLRLVPGGNDRRKSGSMGER